MEPLAAEVEIAIFEAGLLRIFGLARDRHRQFGGRRLDLDRVDHHFNVTGRQLLVDRPALAIDDLARNGDDRLDSQRIERRKCVRPGAADQLGQPIMVAQIDEQHPAMVALAVDPARQANL